MSQEEYRYIPLHLGRLVLRENAYGFFIRHVANPNIISTVLEVAAKYGLTILHISNSFPADPGSKASFVVICDFSRATASPEEVKRAMEKAVGNLDEVKIIKPVLKGLTYDQCHFPIMFMGDRAIIIKATMLKAWLVKIREMFGTGGEAILFYEGFDMGSTIFDDLAERGFKGKDMWSALGAYLFSCGIAKNVSVKFEDSSVEVEVTDSIECSLVKGQGKCFSQWLRGLLSGFASSYFNKKTYARELNCVAKGDGSCLFVIPI